MKKFLLSLAAVAMLATNALATSVTINFADIKSSLPTDDKSETVNSTTTTVDGVEISLSFSHCKAGTYSQISYLQISGKSYKNESAYMTFSVKGYKVTKMAFLTGTNASKNATVNIYADNTKITTSALALNQTNSTFSLNVPEASQNAEMFKVACVAAYNAQIQTLNLEIEPIKVDNRQNNDLKYSAESYFGIFGEVEVTDLPTLANPHNLPVTYGSSDTEVATVDSDGNIELKGAGTTIISASFAGNDEYKDGEVSYTLTLKDAGMLLDSAMGEEFTLENPTGKSYPWTHDATYGLKGSAYVNKTSNASVGYAISPVIDLTDYKDATLNFAQALHQYRENNELIAVENFKGYAYIVAKEEGASDWEIVEEIAAPESFSWDFYAYGPVNLTAYAGKKMQFAFKYISTETVAGTWEIKSIIVNGTKKDVSTGVESVYSDSNAPKEYYNMQGVRVENPGKGLYIVRQGSKAFKVIL